MDFNSGLFQACMSLFSSLASKLHLTDLVTQAKHDSKQARFFSFNRQVFVAEKAK
jgi:hypothetical protein